VIAPMANVVFDSKSAKAGITSAKTPNRTTMIPKFFISIVFNYFPTAKELFFFRITK
jgi:hypothetical protein